MYLIEARLIAQKTASVLQLCAAYQQENFTEADLFAASCQLPVRSSKAFYIPANETDLM
jgi:hypothetical protein